MIFFLSLKLNMINIQARERDIAETISRLSERNQAMLEGFARGLLASDVKQAG